MYQYLVPDMVSALRYIRTFGLKGGACSVIVIIVGNEPSDPNLNPRWGYWLFT